MAKHKYSHKFSPIQTITIGPGISPAQPACSAGLWTIATGKEFHLSSKII